MLPLYHFAVLLFYCFARPHWPPLARLILLSVQHERIPFKHLSILSVGCLLIDFLPSVFCGKVSIHAVLGDFCHASRKISGLMLSTSRNMQETLRPEI